jgi:alpha/beta superfamily hydrolase
MTATFASAQADRPQDVSMLRSVDLAGPSGRLEAVLNQGAPQATFAALICHPHPLHGGTLHNKVVYHAMKALNDPAFGLGWPVLRFNFRGAGLSQGTHDGRAEAGDVLAALDWLQNEFGLPIVAAGFSFGAAMTIAACCSQAPARPHPAALVALGLPTQAEGREYRYSSLMDCTLPKLFLSGDRDPFAPAEQLAQVVHSAADPKRLVLLPRADHFFTGHLAAMQSSLAGWLKEQLL